MTVSELYQSVAQLGFEDSLESDARFLLAANRALLQVNSLRPAQASYTLTHRPPENIFHDGFLEYEITPPDNIICLAGCAKAYYFEVMGEGRVIIKTERKKANGKTETVILDNGEIPFNARTFTPMKGFIRKDGKYLDDNYIGCITFEFEGDYTFIIRNIALYGSVTSPDANRIMPYTEEATYDLAELIPDILSVSMPPYYRDIGGNYRVIADYEIIDGHVLRIPYAAKGTYLIRYDRRVRPIGYPATGGINTSTERVDIADDLAVLLPDLIAAYIWLDDEPEKAQYYLSLYQLNAAMLEKRTKNYDDAPFVSVNGW